MDKYKKLIVSLMYGINKQTNYVGRSLGVEKTTKVYGFFPFINQDENRTIMMVQCIRKTDVFVISYRFIRLFLLADYFALELD